MKATLDTAGQDQSTKPAVCPSRDYQALIEIVLELSQPPDGLGETVLSHEEADKIQAVGFPAAPGQWFVPLLPHNLVRGYGLLECLSDAWAEPPDPRRLLPEQVQKTHQEEEKEDRVEPDAGAWSEDELRVVEAVRRAGGWVKKRKLQKNLWRLGSRRFNRALRALQRKDVLEQNGSMLRFAVS